MYAGLGLDHAKKAWEGINLTIERVVPDTLGQYEGRLKLQQQRHRTLKTKHTAFQTKEMSIHWQRIPLLPYAPASVMGTSQSDASRQKRYGYDTKQEHGRSMIRLSRGLERGQRGYELAPPELWCPQGFVRKERATQRVAHQRAADWLHQPLSRPGFKNTTP